jgi:hypothetical protein
VQRGGAPNFQFGGQSPVATLASLEPFVPNVADYVSSSSCTTYYAYVTFTENTDLFRRERFRFDNIENPPKEGCIAFYSYIGFLAMRIHSPTTNSRWVFFFRSGIRRVAAGWFQWCMSMKALFLTFCDVDRSPSKGQTHQTRAWSSFGLQCTSQIILCRHMGSYSGFPWRRGSFLLKSSERDERRGGAKTPK